MLKIMVGSSEKEFNLIGLSADQVERFLSVLKSDERTVLGKEPISSETLRQVSLQLREIKKTETIVTDTPQVPTGTTAPPSNG